MAVCTYACEFPEKKKSGKKCKKRQKIIYSHSWHVREKLRRSCSPLPLRLFRFACFRLPLNCCVLASRRFPSRRLLFAFRLFSCYPLPLGQLRLGGVAVLVVLNVYEGCMVICIVPTYSYIYIVLNVLQCVQYCMYICILLYNLLCTICIYVFLYSNTY